MKDGLSPIEITRADGVKQIYWVRKQDMVSLRNKLSGVYSLAEDVKANMVHEARSAELTVSRAQELMLLASVDPDGVNHDVLAALAGNPEVTPFVKEQVLASDAASQGGDAGETDDNVVVGPQCYVSDGAQLRGNVVLYDSAAVYHRAKASGRVLMSGNGSLSGDAEARDYAHIGDGAAVKDEAQILEYAKIIENAEMSQRAQAYGDATLRGNVRMSGRSRAFEYAELSGEAEMSGDAEVSGYAKVRERAKISQRGRVSGQAIVEGDAEVSGDAHVTGGAYVGGDVVISEGLINGNAYILSQKYLVQYTDPATGAVWSRFTASSGPPITTCTIAEYEMPEGAARAFSAWESGSSIG